MLKRASPKQKLKAMCRNQAVSFFQLPSPRLRLHSVRHERTTLQAEVAAHAQRLSANRWQRTTLATLLGSYRQMRVLVDPTWIVPPTLSFTAEFSLLRNWGGSYHPQMRQDNFTALRLRALKQIGFEVPDPCYGGPDPCHGQPKDS